MLVTDDWPSHRSEQGGMMWKEACGAESALGAMQLIVTDDVLLGICCNEPIDVHSSRKVGVVRLLMSLIVRPLLIATFPVLLSRFFIY